MTGQEHKDTPPSVEPESGGGGHWQLMRDVIAFQFKLMLDAGRDLLLSPISIGAAVLGLLSRDKPPGYYFDQLMLMGRKTDHWINLFNQQGEGQPSSNDVVRRFEDMVVRGYEKGGAIKDIKDGTDQWVGKVKGAESKPPST